ncbi:hypothetical protein B566_EDAN010951 [Ephemera danica]|nr:hypothetical protein B566_EDAN010951 [Ephemera danica]
MSVSSFCYCTQLFRRIYSFYFSLTSSTIAVFFSYYYVLAKFNIFKVNYIPNDFRSIRRLSIILWSSSIVIFRIDVSALTNKNYNIFKTSLVTSTVIPTCKLFNNNQIHTYCLLLTLSVTLYNF